MLVVQIKHQEFIILRSQAIANDSLSTKLYESIITFNYQSTEKAFKRLFFPMRRQFKAPSTRCRIFLNPQIFLSGYKNFLVYS